jgi:hypothetical protein
MYMNGITKNELKPKVYLDPKTKFCIFFILVYGVAGARSDVRGGDSGVPVREDGGRRAHGPVRPLPHLAARYLPKHLIRGPGSSLTALGSMVQSF